MEWHLDGWDPAAGRAFATQRPRGAELFDHEASWGPTVYIGPPSFSAEQISNFAIALSACRANSFQPRVPLETELPELSFPNADAVAEFVRRAFVSGGRTRGGGGDSAPTTEGGPLEPPTGGNDGEEEPQFLGRYLRDWASNVEDLSHDKVRTALPTSGTAWVVSADSSSHAWSHVESGALQLVTTLAYGFPGAQSNANTGRWYTAASSIHRALSELDLWRKWKQGATPVNVGIQWNFELVARDLMQRFAPKVQLSFELNPGVFVGSLLSTFPCFVERTPETLSKYLVQLCIHAAGVPGIVMASESSQLSERYEAMHTWPLPDYVRAATRLTTVGQLIAAFVGMPGQFFDAPRGVIDIVAFAAALLASHTEDRGTEGWRERAAANWLSRSMPKWIFRAEAEAMIWESAQTRQLAHA